MSGVKNIILITATIAPRAGAPNLSRTDPNDRLNDYLIALSFYLQYVGTVFEHLYFCENSGWDLKALRELVQNRGLTRNVTFLTRFGLDYPPHFGRSYGEWRLIDGAMAEIRPVLQSETIIWKITGRYIIKNIVEIVKTSAFPFELSCNFRNYPKRWVDTYLFAWTTKGYFDCLNGIYENLKTDVPGATPGVAGEEILRAHLDKQRQSMIRKRFKITPDIRGIRAGDSRSYDDKFNFKYRIRRLISHLAPSLWI